jgi:hypothetical protein
MSFKDITFIKQELELALAKEEAALAKEARLQLQMQLQKLEVSKPKVERVEKQHTKPKSNFIEFGDLELPTKEATCRHWFEKGFCSCRSDCIFGHPYEGFKIKLSKVCNFGTRCNKRDSCPYVHMSSEQLLRRLKARIEFAQSKTGATQDEPTQAEPIQTEIKAEPIQTEIKAEPIQTEIKAEPTQAEPKAEPIKAQTKKQGKPFSRRPNAWVPKEKPISA